MGSRRRMNQQLKNQRRQQMVAPINGHRAAIIGQDYGVGPIAAPNAMPGFVNMSTPQGPRTLVIGGLTKLEHAAIEIASRNPNIYPEQAVRVAAEVLNACHNYAQADGDESDETEQPEADDADETKPSAIVLP